MLRDAEIGLGERLGAPTDATASSYADAVATYLGFRAVDKMARLANYDVVHLGRWSAISMRQLFARQAIPMVWDFAEMNPLCA